MREYLPAPEMLTTVTQAGMEVFQLTTDPESGCNVFYNYQQAFEPTSRFVLLNRTGKEGARLMLCDLEDEFQLEPVTDDDVMEGGHQGMSFSPDGKFIWYSLISGERLLLRRRALGGEAAETVFEQPLARSEFSGRNIFRRALAVVLA